MKNKIIKVNWYMRWITCADCGAMTQDLNIRYYYYKFYAWLTKQNILVLCPWCEIDRIEKWLDEKK